MVLGASYGVVCNIARKKLADDVRQICVEQNSDLIDLCRKNSAIDQPESDTQAMNSLIFYPEVADKSEQSGELSSMLTDPQEQPSVAPEMSLGELLKKVALDGPYSLICNIDGTEFDLIEYDQGALAMWFPSDESAPRSFLPAQRTGDEVHREAFSPQFRDRQRFGKSHCGCSVQR